MTKEERPDDFEEIINEELFSLKEARIYICEKLNLSPSYFKKHIRDMLDPRPTIIKRNEGIARSLKVSKSEVDEVIYRIKKKFLDKKS
ncbi:MAG: hypothetical protein WEA58_04090 [Balneolaceae bacterium]